MQETPLKTKRRLGMVAPRPTRGQMIERLASELRGLDADRAIATLGARHVDRPLKTTVSLCPTCLAPVPAIVVIVPSDAMRRMRWPVYSQNQSAPSGPRTTPNGLSSLAERAGPPSPENPFSPVPATDSMVQPELAPCDAGRVNATSRRAVNTRGRAMREFTLHTGPRQRAGRRESALSRPDLTDSGICFPGFRR